MKYIFIINSLGDSHWRNRVDEFINRGYDVILYAYSRNGAEKNFKYVRDVEILGYFDNTMRYANRLGIYYKSIRKVLRKHKNEDVCYYFFGMDTILCALPFIRQPYLYEEFDLVHTYIGNKYLRKVFEWIDKKIIKKSKVSLFTSEGFIQYHFGDDIPNNVCVVPNRLNPTIVDVAPVAKQPIDIKHIKFAFVGGPRFKTLVNFAKIIADNFPQHEMHFYGRIGIEDEHLFTELKKRNNIFFHGFFKNPVDLPQIYSKIDILISTYDTDYENVRWAEPNKIYESIYFDTPIIVSSDTFLARKVSKLGIGWDINCMQDNRVIDFINALTEKDIEDKTRNASVIDKAETLNINDELFRMIHD